MNKPMDFVDKTLDIKDPPAFRFISTFAGCGGSSTGYVWAGGKCLLAVEWDQNAVDTYRLNYPETNIYHGDIAKISVEQALELAGIEPYELDIFDGSPPCQGFSTAGKRILDDERNQLFREYVRLLRGIKPKVMVMENVSGMVKGKMKLVFAEVMKELKASGYKVRCQLLNTMYFGVPQSRQRLIFIGVRDDLGIEPSFPKAWSRGIAVKDAIENAPEYMKDYIELSTKTGQCCIKLKQGQSGSDLFGDNWGFQLIRLNENKVAPTISKSGGATGFIHPTEPRKVSMGELRRLASYPDKYNFIGIRRNAEDRIGNSVPPRFMQSIAEHIRDNILNCTIEKTNGTSE